MITFKEEFKSYLRAPFSYRDFSKLMFGLILSLWLVLGNQTNIIVMQKYFVSDDQFFIAASVSIVFILSLILLLIGAISLIFTKYLQKNRDNYNPITKAESICLIVALAISGILADFPVVNFLATFMQNNPLLIPNFSYIDMGLKDTNTILSFGIFWGLSYTVLTIIVGKLLFYTYSGLKFVKKGKI